MTMNKPTIGDHDLQDCLWEVNAQSRGILIVSSNRKPPDPRTIEALLKNRQYWLDAACFLSFAEECEWTGDLMVQFHEWRTNPKVLYK